MSNVGTAQGIYAAFGAGDIGEILDQLAEDVTWDDWPATSRVPAAVPYLVTRHGRDEVGAFFEAVGSALEFERFEPTAFLANDDKVAAVIEVAMTARSSGRRIEDSEIHLWTFDADGKVTALRHYADTLQHAEAHSG